MSRDRCERCPELRHCPRYYVCAGQRPFSGFVENGLKIICHQFAIKTSRHQRVRHVANVTEL
jgi:hypothetical protein